MTENEYQIELLNWLKFNPQHDCYFGKLPLRYEIGKYTKGKTLGMPDCELDIVSVDDDKYFHLWELKKLDSNELNTGKFIGQLMLYDFLFSSEPWNELYGRFCTKGESNKAQIVGDLKSIYSAILDRTTDDNTEFLGESEDEVIGGDAICDFKTWKLIVCGGKGYELAAGFNPVIWNFWSFQELYFGEDSPKLEIFHFYQTNDGYNLKELSSLSIYEKGGLCVFAREEFEKDFPNC